MGTSIKWFWRAILVVFLVWILFSPQPLYECLSNEAHNYAGDSLKQYAADGIGFLFGIRPCIGAYILDNHEAVLALFTVILAVATIMLWVATRSLLVEAKDSSKRQLRAWVVFKDGKVTVVPAPNDPNEIRFHFEFVSACSGGSPAFDVEMFTQSRIVAPEEGIPHFEIVGQDTPAGILAPGGELAGDTIILSRGEFLDIQNGVRNWYVYNVSRYRTLLDREIERKTETCSRIHIVASVSEKPGTAFNWISQTAGPQNSAT